MKQIVNMIGIIVMIAGLLMGCQSVDPAQVVNFSKTPTASAAKSASAGQLLIGQEVLNSAAAEINNASASIEMDMYELTNPTILKALEAAKDRGVQERIVLDKSSDKAASELTQHGITVHVISVANGINHVKYLAVDSKRVLLGSVNFGKGSGKNEDASLWLPFGDDDKTFFDTIWNGGQPSMQGPTLYNGTATKQKILQLIATAKQSLVIGMFAWTDKDTVNAVIAASSRGVAITAYIDGHQKENAPTIDRLQKAGIRVNVASTTQWLHLKGMVVDNQVTMMGSANWTYHGFNKNDELNFISSSPDVAKSITELLQHTNQ